MPIRSRLAVSASLVLALALVPALSTPALAGIGQWGPSTTLSAAGSDSDDPQVVSVGSNITVVWEEDDGSDTRIRSASSTDSGTTWSAAVTLSEAGQSAFNPSLVTDGTRLTVAWQRNDGSNDVIQSSSSTNGGATWSTPVTVSVAGQDARTPKLATDGNTITATWSRSDGSNNLIQASTSADGATWTAPATLSDTGSNAYIPQIVTDSEVITVVWLGNDGSNDVAMAASSVDDGVNWSSPVTLSQAGGNVYVPQVDTNGTTIVATWAREDTEGDLRIQTAYSTTDGASWSTPVTLSDAGNNSDDPQVLSFGSITVLIWDEPDGSNTIIRAAHSTDGGQTWQAPSSLSASGAGAIDPQLATDGTTVTATWLRRDDGVNRVQTATSIDNGATWSSPDTISPAGLFAGRPQLATNGTTVTVVWRENAVSGDLIKVSSFTPAPDISRLAGADRYETAVAISSEFAADVPVVYLATGANYPDALSAASAAAYQGGPLLLTPTSSLPQVVRNELTRLNPDLVVIVGGTSVVSSGVQSQVSSLLPEATVRRDSGADRYSTSRVIAERAFTGSPTTAFIATGSNFPDALSASAAAGREGAPVILVDGTASGINSATESLLSTLGVDNVVIAGGTSVVSTGIQNELRSIFGSAQVVRLSGSDRYATSAAINVARFSSADSIFLATGLGYADALAGAALAGKNDAPLFVVPGTCVPDAVLTDVARLSASEVVLLGGTAVLTSRVASLRSC
ncbi:MAG: cell wall-binding repeat-containing protein [Microcella sp.]|uniref:cell wall-binding repeat-containing protein n=1 Tax=Microcella sp. TaxID=1913979 RepID=UPI0033150EFD